MFSLSLAVSTGIGFAANPWDKYNFSPKSRTLKPVRIHSTSEGCIGGVIDEWAGKSGTGPVPQLQLACAKGGVISKVDFASFGNPTGSCSNLQQGSCHAANSTAVVEQLCIGKSSCTLPPENDVVDGTSPLVRYFGDPCYGTTKQFAVRVSGCDATHSVKLPLSAGTAGDSIFPITLSGLGSSVVFDFGKEVGGITTLHLGEVSAGASAQLAWSESTYYISTGDNSNGGHGADGSLPTGELSSNTAWVTPTAKLRGGFRYLNVFLDKPGTSITIDDISLQFTPAPTFADPSAYANHFYSDDDLVNRIWYGCAYTVQTNTIDPTTGRVWGPPASGWDNSGVCGVGQSVLVDGAKRDRVIWPGDMGVSTASLYYTTGDTQSSLWALDTLYDHQTSSGMLPYAGPPVSFWGRSDTYHLWALAGTGRLFQYTGNATWMASHWEGFKRGVACSRGKITSKGLMSVDQRADWQRCCQGGENIAANSVLYHVLDLGKAIATAMGDSALAAEWAGAAENLASAINTHLWDANKMAYKDNPSSSLYPQDGNSLAAWFGVADATQASAISDYLRGNWGTYGSGSPEWGMNIGTFPGSMEVNAHAAAGNTDRALDMVRLQWGYMINSPNSTESTFWEGYNKDGTFNFQGIYMSNAHGWSTGAAEMLSTHVLGLSPLSPGGARYTVRPNPGSLQSCHGRLSFANGSVDVAWQRRDNFTMDVDSREHRTGTGEVEMPLFLSGYGSLPVVTLEGYGKIWPQGDVLSTGIRSTGILDKPRLSADGRRLQLVVQGGRLVRLIASASEPVSV